MEWTGIILAQERDSVKETSSPSHGSARVTDWIFVSQA